MVVVNGSLSGSCNIKVIIVGRLLYHENNCKKKVMNKKKIINDEGNKLVMYFL
jgi:hypothetical protein